MPPLRGKHLPAFNTVIDLIRRLAALACLGGAYAAATTGFAQRWVILSIVAAVVVATGPAFWAQPSTDPRPLPWLPRRAWWRLMPGWGLMVLSAAWTLAKLPQAVALVVWLIGFVWLLWEARRLSASSGAPPASKPAPIWPWAVVVLAVAAALRLWEIDTVPRYVHCDEGCTVFTGLQIFAETPFDLFGAWAPAAATMLNLCYAMGALGALVGGTNLTAARIPDVILGILSVLFLLDGLRRVSSLPLAVVSALLLAVNHDHIAFSRIASGYIQTACVVSLLFAVFARVWTAPTYLNSVVLGVVGALGIQTYSASMAVVPILLGIMALLALLHPRRCRELLIAFVLFAITGAATAAPAALTILQHHSQLFVRSNAINIFTEHKMNQLKQEVYHTDSAVEVVARQAWNSLRGFYLPLNGQPQYGSDIYGMADPYTAALMIPGAVLALLGIRQFVAANVLLLTVAYLLLGLGMEWAPGFNRATGALPPGMVLTAIAAVQCCGTFWGRGPLGRWARNLSLAAIVVLCLATNFWIYFVHNELTRGWGEAVEEAGWFTLDYAHDYTVHLVTWPEPGHEGLRLILGGLDTSLKSRVHFLPRGTTEAEYIASVTPTGADVFVMDESGSAARDALLQRFPQARFQTWRRNPAGNLLPASRGLGRDVIADPPTLFLVFVGPPRSEPAAR